MCRKGSEQSAIMPLLQYGSNASESQQRACNCKVDHLATGLPTGPNKGRDSNSPHKAFSPHPDFEAQNAKEHSIESLVLGGVCAKCNNGWMSKLEVEVRPVLEALWGSYRPTILSSKQCYTLAKWTFKTAAVANYASDYKKIIPRAQLRQFYADGCLPANATVDIAFGPPDGIYWLLGGNKRFHVKTKKASPALQKSYVVTLQFERLLLRLAWTPDEHIKAVQIHNVMCRVYPLILPALRLVFRGAFKDRWQLHFSATAFAEERIFPNGVEVKAITKTPLPTYICDLLELAAADANAKETGRNFRQL